MIKMTLVTYLKIVSVQSKNRKSGTNNLQIFKYFYDI